MILGQNLKPSISFPPGARPSHLSKTGAAAAAAARSCHNDESLLTERLSNGSCVKWDGRGDCILGIRDVISPFSVQL